MTNKLIRCGKCGENKYTTQFTRDSSSSRGYDHWCKACRSSYRAARRAENADGTFNASIWTKKYRFTQYGITEDDYIRMLKEQDGKCAICQTDAPGGRHGTWFIDHCHESKEVRGLLCYNCNTGLGAFKDNVHSLARAIEYLTKS